MPSKNRRNLIRWIKRGLMAAFLAAVASMVVVAWLPKPLPVETAFVTRGELVVTVHEDGRTRVKDRYVVSAPLAGTLGRIELRPGDEVREGEVLARVVPIQAPLMDSRTHGQAEARVAAAEAGAKQARAQIERARAALGLAEQEERRIEPLAGQGIEPQASLDRAHLERRTRAAELTSAQFAARVADHQVEMARSALGRMDPKDAAEAGQQLEIPSPIRGRVLRVFQESEGVTQAGAPLVELGDPAALEIVVDVLTRDAVQIERGAATTIERWGGDPLQGNVRLLEPSAFTRISSLGVEEQRVNAVVDLDHPYEEWESLGDGYRVEARITVWRAEDVVKVPASALFRHDDGWAVFETRDGVAKRVRVQVGRRSDLEAQIESGLQANARVIVHPSDRVEDGVEVTWR